MRVKEIAEKAGVTPEVVRYYVRIGLLKSEDKDANGNRRFSEDHLRRLNFIRRAKQAVKTNDVLVVAHGSADEMARSKVILESSNPTRLDLHKNVKAQTGDLVSSATLAIPSH